MFANRPNFRVIEEMGVEEHDDDVRFQTGSMNKAVLHLRIENDIVGHNELSYEADRPYHVPQNVLSYF